MCANWRTCCNARWRCPAAKSSSARTWAWPTTVPREPVAAALDELPRPLAARRRARVAGARCPRRCRADLQAYLDEVERDILVRALERHRYNRTAAGASLGLSLRQMRYRMARLGSVTGEGRVTLASQPRRALARAGGARRSVCASPNFDARPAGVPVSAGGAAFDQPAAGRVWRRRRRAALHQPARLDRPSLLRRIRGLQVSAHFLVRRDGADAAVRVLRAARLACRAARLARAARTATTTRSASSSKAWRASTFEPAQYDALARLLRALARAIRSTRWSATSTWRPGASTTPARASTGAAAQAAAARPAGVAARAARTAARTANAAHPGRP